MGLRCLVGHDYGDPQISRDRDDRGGEVVVTISEYKECTRCGHRQIISENKEIKSVDLDPPEEPTPDEPETVDAEGDDEYDDEYDDLTAEEDDGVILPDAPDDEPGRAHGEWPESDDADGEAGGEGEDGADEGESEPRDWPSAEGDDEGFDAEPGDGGSADEVHFSGGLTPERVPTHPSDATGGSGEVEVGPDPPIGIRSAGSSAKTAEKGRPIGVETDLVCPQCGHTTPATGSSLRPGDICPECRRGYLNESEREE